ncbi:MAG: arginine--tRNA ligase, partial [Schleiferiaceae bacterium]|nr:arginine--tRNA ligase [Schleiferiaceae bacterium]
MSLEQNISKALNELYSVQVEPELQETRKEFDGDVTLVVFPFVRAAKKKPEEVAEELGNKLLELSAIADFNVVKGFLNLTLDRSVYVDQFKTFASD